MQTFHDQSMSTVCYISLLFYYYFCLSVSCGGPGHHCLCHLFVVAVHWKEPSPPPPSPPHVMIPLLPKALNHDHHLSPCILPLQRDNIYICKSHSTLLLAGRRGSSLYLAPQNGAVGGKWAKYGGRGCKIGARGETLWPPPWGRSLPLFSAMTWTHKALPQNCEPDTPDGKCHKSFWFSSHLGQGPQKTFGTEEVPFWKTWKAAGSWTSPLSVTVKMCGALLH